MPRVVDRPLRTKRLLLSFTPDELAAVRARAAAAHIPLARYIREVALGYAPKPKQHAVNAEAVRTLAAVGNTLRAVVTRTGAGATSALEGDAQEAIARILAIVGELR
jgi:hypothetical protein